MLDIEGQALRPEGEGGQGDGSRSTGIEMEEMTPP